MLLYIIHLNSSKDSKMQDFQKDSSKSNGRWTKEEHLNFLEGIRVYGKNWKKIEQLVQTRTGSQIRSHAQKFFLKNQTSETLHDSDNDHLCGNDHEDHDSITGNSKSLMEGGLRREELSYYLAKIVSYSSGRHDLNFWEGLVDCKDATDISHQQRKNSFTSFGDQQEDLEFHEAPMKKLKV